MLTRHGKTPLVFIERPVQATHGRRARRPFTSQDYIDQILAPSLPKLKRLFNDAGIPDEDWVFQQDGDSKHTSRLVQNWLSDNIECATMKEDWPPNSPDLNIIENAWSIIWEEIKTKRITNRKKLKQVVRRAWREKITPEYVQNLYDSIPHRMRAVVAADGKPTKY